MCGTEGTAPEELSPRRTSFPHAHMLIVQDMGFQQPHPFTKDQGTNSSRRKQPPPPWGFHRIRVLCWTRTTRLTYPAADQQKKPSPTFAAVTAVIPAFAACIDLGREPKHRRLSTKLKPF